MSMFSKIKDAIFGSKAAAAPARPAGSSTAHPSAAPKPAAPSASTSATPATGAQSAPAQAVDVEAVLQSMSAQQQQKLNWRTSIVDLMKLVGLDSSLQNRKELAQELGYKGDTSDSAAMNIWLHKRVMQELAAHGGKVPAELKD
jgi:3-oxoacyl-ACP reductase-like protein